MTDKQFEEELQKLGIYLNETQKEQLNSFYELLIEWNEKINLTRIVKKEEVYLKHFYDSLTICKIVNLNEVKTLCDVGTGAGFPGIVLKIAYPHLKITLVDSLQKRVNYLNDVIEKLNLKDICAIHERGENIKNTYDIVTARAVANIEKLMKFTMHLVSTNGKLIAMKGNIDEELTPEIVRKINQKYKIEKIEKFLLPYENSQRSLVEISKK